MTLYGGSFSEIQCSKWNASVVLHEVPHFAWKPWAAYRADGIGESLIQLDVM